MYEGSQANNNKCISDAPNPSVIIYTFKALYTKHYNNTQRSLIIHYIYIYHSVTPPSLRPHTLTLTQSRSTSFFPLSPSQWSRPDRLDVMLCASCLVSSVSVL